MFNGWQIDLRLAHLVFFVKFGLAVWQRDPSVSQSFGTKDSERLCIRSMRYLRAGRMLNMISKEPTTTNRKQSNILHVHEKKGTIACKS